VNALNEFLDRHLTPVAKLIFLINVVVYLLIFIGDILKPGFHRLLVSIFGQSPVLSLRYFQIWRFLTYNFVHVGFMHVLFNMMIFFFFAPRLENRWGARWFSFFYLATGIGAGLFHALVMNKSWGPVIGASGALMGVMLAFAAYYPDQIVYFNLIFPIKIKYLMPILIGFDVFGMRSGDGVSHLTHLSGLAVAYVLLARYHRDWDIRHWRWR